MKIDYIGVIPKIQQNIPIPPDTYINNLYLSPSMSIGGYPKGPSTYAYTDSLSPAKEWSLLVQSPRTLVKD